MHPLGTILSYAFPVVVGIAALEAAVLTFIMKRRYNWKASLASLADAVTRQYILRSVLQFGVAAPAIYWAATHTIDAVPLNPWLAFLVLFLGQEFAYYWFHRCSHRVRWLWATHAVHHSPNELNFSAAYRIGVTGWLSGGQLFYVPLIWLGFSPQAVFATLGLNLLYQFWLHTDWIPKLGPLEYVLNTPSHHRVHHAANLDYLDANYGGILIIFDRLFGTLTPERDDLPCRYGLVEPLTSNNPLVIDFHEWVSLLRDLWRARSVREYLGYLFGPPGWRPNGESLTTEALRRAAAAKPEAAQEWAPAVAAE
jgi:sterol desaturase/sphingolipid hydroxylase (fatty acid hydroxylase superfamily)